MEQQQTTFPSKELVNTWIEEWNKDSTLPAPLFFYIAQRAADWQLEADIEWVDGYAECGELLRKHMRPKLKSLAEEAIEEWGYLKSDLTRHGLGAFRGNYRGSPEAPQGAGGPAMSASRADRLVDEFEIGASLDSGKGFSIRHGLAAVLTHLVDTEADQESFGAVPSAVLQSMVDALTAPTLLDRALAGDAEAARQFLRKAGFTDEHGALLPYFRPCQD